MLGPGHTYTVLRAMAEVTLVDLMGPVTPVDQVKLAAPVLLATLMPLETP